MKQAKTVFIYEDNNGGLLIAVGDDAAWQPGAPIREAYALQIDDPQRPRWELANLQRFSAAQAAQYLWTSMAWEWAMDGEWATYWDVVRTAAEHGTGYRLIAVVDRDGFRWLRNPQNPELR